jgi:hypothetical protein
MYPETIFTLDARENIFLELMASTSKLSTGQIYQEIRSQFENLIDILRQKSIKYEGLKNALIPRSGRVEIALAFDISQIESASYGADVFGHILPLLERELLSSCLCGDYIGSDGYQPILRDVFLSEIQKGNAGRYKHSSQYFIVYFNNLSDRQFSTLIRGLSSYNAFAGYFDLSFSSPMKTLVSPILVRLCIIKKKTVLLRSEGSVDGNYTFYPFEENGYTCIGIDDLCYMLFLSYKIEREVFPGFEIDTLFSINAISHNVFDIREFTLLLEESKLEYLRGNKSGNLARVNLHNVSRSEIENVIRRKLNENYIYNLSYSTQYKTAKFNIQLEIPSVDNSRPMKMLAALEYIPDYKRLRLITFY